ncbi:MAG: glycosyltransferase [Nitrospirae bacterium]|nr:glycosyltransferase [Nitrospirota bacterium]
MKHLSHCEIYKYDYVYQNYPDYGQVNEDEPRFIVALNYLLSISDVNTVLDAGAGRGGFYKLIKNRYDVDGIEPSTVAIETFHKDDSRIINIYVQELITHFPDNKFDVVTCLDVLEHIPHADIDVAIYSLNRVGKKYFIFSVANHEDFWDGMDLHVSLFSFEEWEGRFNKYFKVISKNVTHKGKSCIYLLEKLNTTDNKLSFDFAKFERLQIKRGMFGKPYTPASPEFLLKKRPSSLPAADVIDCVIIPRIDKGVFNTGMKIRGTDGQIFHLNGEWAYTDFRRGMTITNPLNGEKLNLTLKSIFELWSGRYDFEREAKNYLCTITSKMERPRIAFTIKNSIMLGGGTLILFRYVNWLVELGVDVAIYSDSKPPDWTTVKARFHHIPDPRERYSAIEEPVVIVYSVLELPLLLSLAKTKDKSIIHLCQGVEDFHYYNPNKNGVDGTLPIFQVFHSLPVGRLVVSQHLQRYFEEGYNQQCYTIINGIDTSIYTPRQGHSPSLKGTVTVMVAGNPEHSLKGIRDVVEAMLIMARKMPDTRFHIINVCGADALPYDDISIYSVNNLTYSLHCGLSPQEMREMYHAADVYVNASWYEGFGMPTLEAMACGVPVIQAKNYGLDGIVEDGINCLLVSHPLPEQIAAMMERLLTSSDIYQGFVKNGIETTKKFSLLHQYEMFVPRFEEILGWTFDTELVEKKKHELRLYRDTVNTLKVTKAANVKPLISVLVPTYNQADYLPQTLDSLLSQTYDNWEAVIVNDGSTDDTPLVLEKYATKDSRFRIFHKKNGGVGSALNEALSNACGEWICWLSSDDLFLPSKLKIHTYGFKKYPHIKIFHTDYYVLNGNQISYMDNYIEESIPPTALQVLKFFQINYFNGISICIHRSIFEHVGFFKENLRNGQDFDMWLRISSLYRSQVLPLKTCVTRVHPSSGTQLSIEAGIFDSARACLEFLNKHTFAELFPMLDLQQEDQFIIAFRSIVEILANSKSFINRCGYAQALIDRMREWLATSSSTQTKSSFDKTFENINRVIQNSSLSEDIKAAFELLKGATSSPFRFKPYDPLKEIMCHAERLGKSGNGSESVIIRQYLERIKRFEDCFSGGLQIFSDVINKVERSMTADGN